VDEIPGDEKMRLEIGCGVDRSYKFNPKIFGENVVYVDVEKPVMKIPNFIRCDAKRLPFKSLCFTEVYASHVIEHLENPLKFLLEVRRVLVSNGKVWLWTPNFTSPNARKDPSHRYVFNYFSLKATLRVAGFQPVMFLPYISYKIFKPFAILLTNELYACGEKASIIK
jgi:ubiquinone/menaquinone biosynthesis C-methylase UbiE